MQSPQAELKEALSDRPPMQHASNGCVTGDLVRQDLDALAARARVAIRHAAELNRSAPAGCTADTQRDALHLLVRMETLAHQIEDAKETLARIQQREGSSSFEPSPSSPRSMPVFHS